MFLSVIRYIGIIFEVLLIFNLVIIVHELGHFLAARWRGLVVEEFGVWFGKPLWRKKIGSVYYSLGSIPAGGFVKLPQMAAMETLEGDTETPKEQLPIARPLDKIIVAFAGPFFSLLLALTLGCVTWIIGTPTSQRDNTTEIGLVLPGGPADRAGLKRGDKVLAIDGKPVTRFSGATNSIMWGIAGSQGDTIDFLVLRDGKEQHFYPGFALESGSKFRRRPTRKIQIGPRFEPEVAEVAAGSVGEKAGLKIGDLVTKVNGQPIITLEQIEEAIKQAPGAALVLEVKRKSDAGSESLQEITIPAATSSGAEAEAYIPGVLWGHFFLDHPTPFHQVADAVRAMRNMIGSVLSPKGNIGLDQFSGPVGIMNLYRRILAADEGWRLAIAFSVFFNVNLALVNMLPFPVLDGGHITLALIEAARRRPVNARAMEVMQTACALLLVGFLVFVSFFDIGDMVPKGKPAPPPEKPPAAEASQPASTP